MSKHDADQYSAISRFFHWGIAFLILGLIPVGFYMSHMAFSPLKLEIYGVHKSLGLTVLLLAVLRIAYRIYKAPPKSLSTYKVWENFFSKTIHVVLYVAIIVMPVLGWVMSSAGDFSVSFFGLFDMPRIVEKDAFIFGVARSVHEIASFVVIGAVGLHVVGALKHHFIDGDVTLIRMGGRPVFGFIAIFVLIVALAILIRAEMSEHHDDAVVAVEKTVAPLDDVSVDAQVWDIDVANSSIGFSFYQYGSEVSGSFNVFDGEIIFDPDDLVRSAARIVIDVNSIATGSGDRDGQARSDVWFDAQNFPQMMFESARFAQGAQANQFVVEGFLNLRGVRLPVSFPFLLDVTQGDAGARQAKMVARLTLNRLDFGVGQGEWESTEAIGNAVEIDLNVVASQL